MDWQLEILMEKLRGKQQHYKQLPEIAKNVRMAMLDKRYALDSVDKSQHQKCLDTLQHSIKVTSLQSMIERLESLTRQLGLKFVVESSGVFISSDMFYLEIVLDQNGSAKDVKIHHEGKIEQQSCMELAQCLTKGDFLDFTAQLQGFTSIYQLNADKKVKCKAFTALESLENDLNTLSQLQIFMKEPFNLIHKSPVGILEKRKGGHAMKLTYFVSPYDLVNTDKCDLEPISVEQILHKKLGYSVQICMESSKPQKLQIAPLITVNRNVNGKSTPNYTNLSGQNSTIVPACFVLKLNKPMPICGQLLRKIHKIVQCDELDQKPLQPLLNLIVSDCSNGKMTCNNNQGLFVNLPDQNHCYFLTESKNINGLMIDRIPFSHPAHVSQILMLLREQALFNTVIGSCVRPKSIQDFDKITMFEIGALNSAHISISLEHSTKEGMATAELDLSDISRLICRIYYANCQVLKASELCTKILNRTFSIPVTLRAILKEWQVEDCDVKGVNGENLNFSLPLGPGGPKTAVGGPQFQPSAENTKTEHLAAPGQIFLSDFTQNDTKKALKRKISDDLSENDSNSNSNSQDFDANLDELSILPILPQSTTLIEQKTLPNSITITPIGSSKKVPKVGDKKTDLLKKKKKRKDDQLLSPKLSSSTNLLKQNSPKSAEKLKKIALNQNKPKIPGTLASCSSFSNALASSSNLQPKLKLDLDLNCDSLTLEQKARNRKGSLSAIVDKLKNAQPKPELKLQNPKIGEPKNSEYMVKSSSEGIKITINKTKNNKLGNKSSSSSNLSSNSSSSGSNSPKIHTGLKPGVNSGPASKKTLTNSGKLVNQFINNKLGQKNHNLGGLNKLSSSSTSSTKFFKDKLGKSASSSQNKPIFSTSIKSKNSPNSKQLAEDAVEVFKAQYPPILMDGMMKQLDKNFQIPKLSQRVNLEEKKAKELCANAKNTTTTVDTKIFDMSLPKLSPKLSGINLSINADLAEDAAKKDLTQTLQN